MKIGRSWLIFLVWSKTTWRPSIRSSLWRSLWSKLSSLTRLDMFCIYLISYDFSWDYTIFVPSRLTHSEAFTAIPYTSVTISFCSHAKIHFVSYKTFFRRNDEAETHSILVMYTTKAVVVSVTRLGYFWKLFTTKSSQNISQLFGLF